MSKKDSQCHSELIDELQGKVEHLYDVTVREVQWIKSGKTRVEGEMDLVGINGCCFDVYEVKVRKGKMAARRQLRKAQNHLASFDLAFMTYDDPVDRGEYACGYGNICDLLADVQREVREDVRKVRTFFYSGADREVVEFE